MKREPKKIIGFLIFWFGFAFTVGLVSFLIYIELFTFRFLGFVIAGIIVMIHGLYTMTGSKFIISKEFWREKFGVGYPVWFGAIIEFYLDIIVTIILCILLVIFVAPTSVQRLFILFIGNTVLCLLLYFKFKDRRKLD